MQISHVSHVSNPQYYNKGVLAHAFTHTLDLTRLSIFLRIIKYPVNLFELKDNNVHKIKMNKYSLVSCQVACSSKFCAANTLAWQPLQKLQPNRFL